MLRNSFKNMWWYFVFKNTEITFEYDSCNFVYDSIYDSGNFCIRNISKRKWTKSKHFTVFDFYPKNKCSPTLIICMHDFLDVLDSKKKQNPLIQF